MDGGRDKKVLPHNKKSVTADKPRQAPAARGGLGVVQGKKARSNENMDPGKIQDAPQALFPESWTAKRPQAAKIDPRITRCGNQCAMTPSVEINECLSR